MVHDDIDGISPDPNRVNRDGYCRLAEGTDVGHGLPTDAAMRASAEVLSITDPVSLSHFAHFAILSSGDVE
jgi:hypothetical protein